MTLCRKGLPTQVKVTIRGRSRKVGQGNLKKLKIEEAAGESLADGFGSKNVTGTKEMSRGGCSG